jgi:integrase
VPRNGDGIYTRKDRPGYFISYKDAEGRRRRRKVAAPNRKKAGDLRSGYVSRSEQEKAYGVRPPGPETFEEVAEKYLVHQKPRISAANFERERGIVEDHLKPFFAGELRAVRRATVARYITARCAEVSSATVIKEVNVLKHLLRLAAEEWEYLPVNPIPRSMRPPKPAPGRMRYLQPGELSVLLESAPLWLRPIIVLAIATGMRRSEILRLRWLDVDLNGARALLPKTKNGEGRIVYLNRLALKAIELLPVSEKSKPTDVLFPDLDPHWVSVCFMRLCRKLGVADFHFHDLRHTAASWLRMKGADIHTVAQLLGHKDLRMAARYQHLSPAFLADAVEKLDGAFELCHQYVTRKKELTERTTEGVEINA